jgi:transposase-like protein
VNHFGPIIAAELRKRRPKPHAVWHLDEVYLKIDGRMVYLWRAVDAEGEVLDVPVQSKRDKRAALKLMRKLLRKYAVVPERLVTDDLRSYGAATLDLGIDHLPGHEPFHRRHASVRRAPPVMVRVASAKREATTSCRTRTSIMSDPPGRDFQSGGYACVDAIKYRHAGFFGHLRSEPSEGRAAQQDGVA